MGYGYKTCKICGKEYRACSSPKRTSKVFRWQSVSCSPECGSIFLDRLIAARSKPVDTVEIAEPDVSTEELYTPLFDDEDIEDEFEDEEVDE